MQMTSATLIIKPCGDRCNIHCGYCYNRNVYINDEFSSNLKLSNFYSYLDKFKDYKNIFIVFHGGEPLLKGIIFFEEILSYISENFKNKWNVQVQTNGTLLNDKYIDLFSRYIPNLSVSVSIDPIGVKDLRFFNDSYLRQNVISNISDCAMLIPNTGIISIAHKYNIDYFNEFIENLIDANIHSLTVNKIKNYNLGKSEFFITELDYVNLLISICKFVISNKLYQQINIQPLYALFSSCNKFCNFLNDNNKCFNFKTYDGSSEINQCEHYNIAKNYYINSQECNKCSIVNRCGRGCYAEKRDETFCEARKLLFDFIDRIANDSKKIKC